MENGKRDMKNCIKTFQTFIETAHISLKQWPTLINQPIFRDKLWTSVIKYILNEKMNSLRIPLKSVCIFHFSNFCQHHTHCSNLLYLFFSLLLFVFLLMFSQCQSEGRPHTNIALFAQKIVKVCTHVCESIRLSDYVLQHWCKYEWLMWQKFWFD